MSRAVYRACLYIDSSDDAKREVVQILADHFNFNVDPDFAVSLMNEWKIGVSNAMCEYCLGNSIGEYVEAGILQPDTDVDELKSIVWHSYDMSDIEAEFAA